MNDIKSPHKATSGGSNADTATAQNIQNNIIHYDICIVGNGAVGKTAALGLAQAGLRVVLLGAPPVSNRGNRSDLDHAAWDTRVYALNHVARALLSSLKVWDALDGARVTAVDGMQIKGGVAENAGSVGFDAFSARTDALAWIIEDRNLNQALDAALKFAQNVRVISGRARQMNISADVATLHLEDGTVLKSTLLIGADGAQSWVRNQCDIGIDYRSYYQRAIVANFSTERPHHGIAYQWFTENEGIVALLPLVGQRVSLVWSAPNALADTLSGESLTQCAERLTALAGGVFGQLLPLQPEAVQSFPLSFIRSHALVAPRVALIGDAAHVVHPLAGHGMNLGFGDVAVLIKVLSDAMSERQRDCGDVKVLARYARARKEEIATMQIATDGLARLFDADLPPIPGLRAARNFGLNLLDKLPVLKRRMISHALGRSYAQTNEKN